MEQSKVNIKKTARHQRILTIALDAFLENGYANTSMATIAERVGGSKGTLYNHVKSKEDLFLACIEFFLESHSQQAFSAIDSGGNPTEVLTKFCQFFLRAIMSKTDLALNRLVIAESERFPAIGKAFFFSGPEFGVKRLSAYLSHAMDNGDLRKDDPVKAAKILLGLCQLGIYREVQYNVSPPPGPKKLLSEAKDAVAVFMSHYGIH